MPDESATPTPDEELADMIVHHLARESLIAASETDVIRAAIASGQASLDDWSFWLESKIERDSQGDTRDATG